MGTPSPFLSSLSLYLYSSLLPFPDVVQLALSEWLFPDTLLGQGSAEITPSLARVSHLVRGEHREGLRWAVPSGSFVLWAVLWQG